MRIVGQRAPVGHGCVGLCTFGILRKGWRLLGFAPGPFTALRFLAPPPLCLRVPPQFFGAASSHGAGGLLGELALPGLFLEALLLLFLAFLGLLLLADASLLFSSEAFLFEVLLLVAAPVFAGAGGLLGEFSFPDRFLGQLFFATLFLFRATLFYGAGGFLGELALPGFFLSPPLLVLLPLLCLLFLAAAGLSCSTSTFPFGRFARCALPKRLAIALAGRRLDVAQCPHDREPNDVCDRCRISGRIRRPVRDRCRNRLHTEGFLEGDRSFCRLAVGEGVANVRQVDPARDMSGRQGGVFIVREPDRASAKSVEELELRIRSELGFDDHDLRAYVPR